MSLAEIEKQVLNLSQEERREFAAWFYQNESEILPAPSQGDQILPEVMAELLRRRQEIENGTVKFITLDELDAGMGEAIDEVRRKSH